MIRPLLKDYFLKPLCFAIVILITLFFLNQFTYFNISLGSNSNLNSFEVIGEGKITATPSIATTSFSIEEKGTTQEAAKNAANTKQNAALKELEALGIQKKDITSTVSVNPNYEVTPLSESQVQIYPPTKQVQNGYVAFVSTEVKGSKGQLDKAIDKLTALGLNVGGVSYTFADRQQYVNEAQDKAISNAKEQAQNLAKAAGFKLGKIVTIRNADDNYGYGMPYASDASNALKSSAPSVPTDLQPGSNEITARMGVTYYIKN